MTEHIAPTVLSTVPNLGDIALVMGPSKGSKLIVWLQRAAGRRQAKFSHVLLYLGADVWMQAMPVGGIHTISTRDAFLGGPDERPKRYALLRPPPPAPKATIDRVALEKRFGKGAAAVIAMAQVAVTGRDTAEWLRFAYFFYGQKYNFLLLLPKLLRDHRKFCSELVAAVYAMKGIEPFKGRRASIFAPADLQFEQLARADGPWSDQTDMLNSYLSSIGKSHQDMEETQAAADSVMELSKRALGLQTVAVIGAAQEADRNLKNAIGPGRKRKPDEQLSVIEQELRRFGYGVGTKKELDAFISEAEEALRRVDFVAGTASGAPWMGNGDLERYRDLRKHLRRHLREARRKRGNLR